MIENLKQKKAQVEAIKKQEQLIAAKGPLCLPMP